MITFKLHPNVKIAKSKKGDLSLHLTTSSEAQELVLKKASSHFLSSIKKLQQEGADEKTLIALLSKNAGQDELCKFYYFLTLLKRNNFLSYTLVSKSRPLLTILPLSTRFQLDETPISPGQKIKLSKFAYFRTSETGLLLETPLSPVQCQIHSQEIISLLHQLSRSKSLKELRSPVPRPVLEKLLSLLCSLKILVVGSFEEKDPSSLQWEFHDLLFHSRTRTGRHDNPYGGIYPFKKTLPALPICKLPMSAEKISLFQPDIEKLKETDPSLTRVIEERRSKREHGKDPITLKQLGEFLFRTVRIKEVFPGGLSRRPYPSGGAIYELELYLAITRCQGVVKGVYHYNPKEHALYRLDIPEEKVDLLARDATNSAIMKEAPQILFIITSRFARMSWKYRSMAYAATLKNTGVLLQTMYLVGTAMDLAPCAIGGGNADLFAETVGTNYLEESSVGEFILGSQINAFD